MSEQLEAVQTGCAEPLGAVAVVSNLHERSSSDFSRFTGRIVSVLGGGRAASAGGDCSDLFRPLEALSRSPLSACHISSCYARRLPPGPGRCSDRFNPRSTPFEHCVPRGTLTAKADLPPQSGLLRVREGVGPAATPVQPPPARPPGRQRDSVLSPQRPPDAPVLPSGNRGPGSEPRARPPPRRGRAIIQPRRPPRPSGHPAHGA